MAAITEDNIAFRGVRLHRNRRRIILYLEHFTGTDTMNRDELVSQICFLIKLQEDKDVIIYRQQESLDEMKADLKDNKALQKQLAESSNKLDVALASVEELRHQLTDMMNRNDLNNQHRFGSRSKK